MAVARPVLGVVIAVASVLPAADMWFRGLPAAVTAPAILQIDAAARYAASLPGDQPVVLVVRLKALKFLVYQRVVHDWGFWFIIAKAFTPLPFKIAAIAAGVAAMPFLSFMIAAIIGRALHFAMVGALLTLYGGRILALLARFERPFAVISVLVVIGLVVVAYHLR